MMSGVVHMGPQKGNAPWKIYEDLDLEEVCETEDRLVRFQQDSSRVLQRTLSIHPKPELSPSAGPAFGRGAVHGNCTGSRLDFSTTI